MKHSKYLLLAVLLVGLFSLACSLTDKAVDKAKDAAQDAVQEVSQTAEAAAGEVAQEAAQQAEKAGEEVQKAAQEAQEKAAESGEKVEETAKEAQESAEAAVEGKEGEMEEAPLEIGKVDDALSTFNSYRANISISFEGEDRDGNPSSGSIMMLTEYIKDPKATHTLMKMEGTTAGEDDGSVQMEIYVVDGMSYTYMEEFGWMSMPADDSMNEGFLTYDDLMSDFDLPKNAKRSLLPQDVNGISTWHYTFDKEDITKEMIDVTIEDANGEVWVARDGGYPVKMEIEIKGKDISNDPDTGFANGLMKISYELKDVNQNFTIEVPEEALAGSNNIDAPMGGGNDGNETGGAGVDVLKLPLPDDAEVQFSMAGMLNYATSSSVENVADFYKEKLAAAGWQADDMAAFLIEEDSAMLSFTKDNAQLSVIISKEDDGKVNVSLIGSE